MNLIGKKDIRNKSTYRLQSFKVSKYSTVKLDYRPKSFEFLDPFFVLTYDLKSPYIDVFNKSGEPIKRINV